MTRAPSLALVVGGIVAVFAAWVVATPPWAGPDEAAHYLRALTITQGRLLGPKTGIAPANRAVMAQGGFLAKQQRFIVQDQTNLVVPPRLSPPNIPCLDGRRDVGPASCTEMTYEGNFPPLGYLLPAAALGTAHTATSGIWRSREASALETLAFLVLALVLVGWRSGWPLVGLLAAVPPGALNIGSLLGPSGIETTANLAFIAALLKLDRDGRAFPRWGWIALALSGVVTLLAWQLGPVFAALDLFACGLLSGRVGLRRLASEQRRASLRTAAALVVALVLFLIYGKVSGVLHSNLDFSHFGASLRDGWYQTRVAIKGGIGYFAAGQVTLSSLMMDLWVLGVAGLALAALVLARVRERIVLVVVGVVALAFPILFYAFSLRTSGFGLQGRHVLPALALIPMLAGELLDRRAARRGDAVIWRSLAAASVAAIAVYQLLAWWHNAHYWAGTSASGPFLSHSTWSPPLGWTWWVLVLAAGALAMLAAAGLAAAQRLAARP